MLKLSSNATCGPAGPIISVLLGLALVGLVVAYFKTIAYYTRASTGTVDPPTTATLITAAGPRAPTRCS